MLLFFSDSVLYALSNDVNKFCDVTSSTLVARRDSVLKKIFPTGNYKLYFPQKLLTKSFSYVTYTMNSVILCVILCKT